MTAQAQATAPEPTAVDEYASYTLENNHLVNEAAMAQGKAVIATVSSTEEVEDALLSQMNYFGDLSLLQSRSLRKQLEAVEGRDCFIVYATPRQGQENILFTAGALARVLNDEKLGGSILAAHVSILSLAADLTRQERQNAIREARQPMRVLFHILPNPEDTPTGA